MMLKGKISIGRYTSNKAPDICWITISDEVSGTQFLEIQLTPENLGLALTGLSSLDCQFDLRGSERVGKQREQKTEVVTIYPPKNAKVHQALREASKLFLADGWLPMINDNSRYEPIEQVSEREWSYRVTFVRWVD